tara:strand:+ start:72 stop:434 length:363 start_codon:yes stop_codon:yes gene_type:complete
MRENQRFDDLIFKSVVPFKGGGAEFITLKERSGSIVLGLSVGVQDMCNSILPNYNGIEVLVAGDSVFAIRPKIKPKTKNQSKFTATALKGVIKDLPLNKRLFVVEHKGMVVCDLRKTDKL